MGKGAWAIALQFSAGSFRNLPSSWCCPLLPTLMGKPSIRRRPGGAVHPVEELSGRRGAGRKVLVTQESWIPILDGDFD